MVKSKVFCAGCNRTIKQKCECGDIDWSIRIKDMKKLDEHFFVYGNSISTALNNKNIKQAKKFLGEWFEKYMEFKEDYLDVLEDEEQ